MQSLFEQFQGSDIDRLTKCFSAIGKANLRMSKNTQAGVNQSNGNVWVWDEEWCGSVFCSINFSVLWCHTCSDCGEEYFFDDYSALAEYVESYEGYCEACHTVED
jgi:hypothetical protein